MTRTLHSDWLKKNAKEQVSTHSDKLYIIYTKLANTIVGEKRGDMTAL